MELLTGWYQHAIDSKGRVLIPNKVRNNLESDEDGDGYYLSLGPNGILCMYPEKYFERIVRAGMPWNGAPDEAVAFERISFALAGKVELDSQGRLLLNEGLRKTAKLRDNVTVVGVGDHIELWNSEDWEQYLMDHMPQYQKQVSFARQVVLQEQAQQQIQEQEV